MHVCVGCKYVVCKAERDLQAREAAASPKASVKRRAETTYASVVRKYPDSRPGEIAAAELKKLKPNSKVLSSSPKTESHTSSELRTWKNADGKFTVSAAVVSEQNGKVTLKKADGKTIDVTEEQLSEGDRRYLSVWRELFSHCLLYTSPSPRDKRQSRMPSSA